MKHKTELECKVSMKDLAEEIGNLRYDVLNEFINALSNKLYDDGIKDIENGRPKLGECLESASICLFNATLVLDDCDDICKKHY